MIFTWYFSCFSNIPGLGKYGFWCSVCYLSVHVVEKIYMDSTTQILLLERGKLVTMLKKLQMK